MHSLLAIQKLFSDSMMQISYFNRRAIESLDCTIFLFLLDRHINKIKAEKSMCCIRKKPTFLLKNLKEEKWKHSISWVLISRSVLYKIFYSIFPLSLERSEPGILNILA